MGRPFSLMPKVPSGTSLRMFAFFGALFLALTLLFPAQTVLAFGENYSWSDKDTITGSGGNLGNTTHAFSKSGGMYYGGTKLTEMYIYSEQVMTPDNCGVMLGIQVGSNTGAGTLRRVMDPVLDAAGNACPKEYNISKAFTTNLRLANADKSGSEPSQKVTIIVRSLVSKDEEYPGTTDTLSIKDATGKVLVKRGVDKNDAYAKGDWKGFERKFILNTSIGSDKQYEACSAALNMCETASGTSIITAPLGVFEIEIKKDPVDTTIVCSAGALGWVFCPLSEFLQDTVTGIAGFLEGMLTYDPLLSSEQGKAIRAIWGTVLVIANVGLIIAFLAVVFSQATSVGISTYGVKKLLPRIIAAAILMNLSFYICAIAVDIANILGISIKGIVDAGISVIAGNKTGSSQSGAEWYQSVTVAITAAGGIAIAFGTGAIALLLPIVMSAVLAVLTAFLVLAAREVIITLLIIVAPLAFLAWVLPNTDEWFTKWRKLFTAMLVMFPLVMAIFYGSVLVSSLVMATRQNGTGVQGNMEDLMVNLLALGILVIPLFSLPFIMKSAGGTLDRLGILVNNKNKGLVDRSRKKAEEWKGNSAYQRSRAARRSETQARRSRDFYEAMAGGGSKRKRVLGRAGYTGMGTSYLTKGGRVDARRTSDNIADMYRKQQTEATARNLAGLVEGGAFSQGSSYRVVGANGQELLARTGNHRDMVPSVLAAQGAMLEVTDAAGKTRTYNGDDVKSALMSKTAQMGDVPLTDSILAQGGETAAGMREFISYNAGSYSTKAPDYIKGPAGAFGDPKAAELVGWHASTATRAATFAGQDAAAARNMAAALNEAMNNDNLRGELNLGAVQNLIGQENTAIWHSLSAQEQQTVRDFLSSHNNPNPNPGGGGGTP